MLNKCYLFLLLLLVICKETGQSKAPGLLQLDLGGGPVRPTFQPLASRSTSLSLSCPLTKSGKQLIAASVSAPFSLSLKPHLALGGSARLCALGPTLAALSTQRGHYSVDLRSPLLGSSVRAALASPLPT